MLERPLKGAVRASYSTTSFAELSSRAAHTSLTRSSTPRLEYNYVVVSARTGQVLAHRPGPARVLDLALEHAGDAVLRVVDEWSSGQGGLSLLDVPDGVGPDTPGGLH